MIISAVVLPGTGGVELPDSGLPRNAVAESVHFGDVRLGDRVLLVGRRKGKVRVRPGAARPVAEIAVRIAVEIIEVGRAAVGREIIRRQSRVGVLARRSVMKHVQQRIAGRAADGIAEQVDAAHHLGEFMFDDADKVVIARNRPVVRIVRKRKNVAEPGVSVDIGAGLLKRQPERLGFRGSDPHCAVDRHTGRQACCGRRVDTGKRIGDARITVVTKKGFAFAQRIRLQLLPVDLAVADIDVDGDRCGENALVVADDIIDGSDKARRQAAHVLVVTDVNGEPGRIARWRGARRRSGRSAGVRLRWRRSLVDRAEIADQRQRSVCGTRRPQVRSRPRRYRSCRVVSPYRSSRLPVRAGASNATAGLP